ncbi:hypothetical protein BDV93DRAFT_515773 [Ceratobasidium sp. AG-I]|nr:hypothetical protein BDV93DRAFT_515773 [Ceratobasidium sp. AG-I]
MQCVDRSLDINSLRPLLLSQFTYADPNPGFLQYRGHSRLIQALLHHAIASSPILGRNTEVETSSAISEGSSNFSAALKNKCRHKTAQKQKDGDLEIELAMCNVRLKDSKAVAYATFEDPVLIDEDDCSVTHYGFQCKCASHHLSSPGWKQISGPSCAQIPTIMV